MPFPTAPSVGTLYTNPLGTIYRYNSKGAWQLHKIGRGYFPETGSLSLAPDVMPPMIVGVCVLAGRGGLRRDRSLHLLRGRRRAPSGPDADHRHHLRNADDCGPVRLHHQGRRQHGRYGA